MSDMLTKSSLVPDLMEESIKMEVEDTCVNEIVRDELANRSLVPDSIEEIIHMETEDPRVNELINPLYDDSIIRKFIHPSDNYEKSAVIAKYQHEDLRYFSPESRDWQYLYAIEYCSLYGETFIEGAIIDAFILVKKSKGFWGNNISYYPNRLTDFILGNSRNRVQKNTFCGYNVEREFDGLVFVPFSTGNHWNLLVLNTVTEEVLLIDPFKNVPESQIKYKINYFLRYLKRYLNLRPNTINNLTRINWKIGSPPEWLPTQVDGCNCGCFVMMYMDILATKCSSNNINFNPYTYRNEIARFLINNSLPMNDVCLGCTSTKKSLQYECSQCQRKVHEKCKEYFIDDVTCIFCNQAVEFIPPEVANDVIIINQEKKLIRTSNEDWKNKYVGFPNPPGKNSCWLNATLQAILVLPFFEDMGGWYLQTSCPRILKLLVEIKQNSTKGLISQESMKTLLP